MIMPINQHTLDSKIKMAITKDYAIWDPIGNNSTIKSPIHTFDLKLSLVLLASSVDVSAAAVVVFRFFSSCVGVPKSISYSLGAGGVGGSH